MTTPTLAEIIRTAVENRLAEVHIRLPGRVERYDAKTQKADITPLLKRFQQAEGGDAIVEEYPVIPNVPVAFPRVGKFSITFPVAKGDNITLAFCESSIDAYQIGGGREPVSPDLFQRFDLSDAVAIPGWYPDGKALSSTDAENIVIGMDGLDSDFVAIDGKTRAAIDAVIDDVNDLKAAFTAWLVVASDGGAALKAAAATWTAATLPSSSSVAAQKLKVT